MAMEREPKRPHQGKQANFACAKSDNDCDDGDDDKTDF